MTRFELLLTKLSEECSEVSQIALKTQQFGKLSSGPDHVYNNKDRLHQELDDLLTIVDMLNEEFNLDYERNEGRAAIKKEKVNKYYKIMQTFSDEEKQAG